MNRPVIGNVKMKGCSHTGRRATPFLCYGYTFGPVWLHPFFWSYTPILLEIASFHHLPLHPSVSLYIPSLSVAHRLSSIIYR
ncbi:hypothetical protein ACRASS_13670 [Bacteroides hominis]|uniref:hypothetical protein n=1 Tax=Bacteroides TaxID=816 RepID=UPI00202EB8BB|nr:hypothetical protein [Bacteroides fragilis]MCM0370999.1 hypothetical protein [Bacteroides fragilis]